MFKGATYRSAINKTRITKEGFEIILLYNEEEFQELPLREKKRVAKIQKADIPFLKQYFEETFT